MVEDIKLKNVSNPLEILATLKTIVNDTLENSEVIDKIKDVHESLSGTSYTKVFTSLDDCTLLNGSSNLAGGYVFC